MKKIVIGIFLVTLAFSAQAFAGEKIEVKTKKDGTVVEKAKWENENVKGKEKATIKKDGDYKYEAKAKDKNTGAKAEEKVVSKGDATWTDKEIKGKNAKIKKKTIKTPKGIEGKTKVHIKKGALANFRVNYNYYQKGTEYILDYEVKNIVKNKALMDELNLTPAEAKAIKSGKHTVVSTSPYTAGDMKADFRSIILKDLVTSVRN